MSASRAAWLSVERIGWAIFALGFVALIAGSVLGLQVEPDARMGELVAIMFVHVPAAWNALLVFAMVAVGAAALLVTGRHALDAFNEAAIEVGLVLTALLLVLGSIWGKPTWGTWWDWDPRLTSCAVLALSFVGVLALRARVDDPSRRASWTAVTSILGCVNLPITYFSVYWWRSLHQPQSTPDTVDPRYVLPLRINALAMLVIAIGLIVVRYTLARRKLAAELTPLPERREELA